jgi:hypothetical protein
VAIVKRPALYNGIRHFVFVIPPMTVLAGTAFAWGMKWLKENRRSWQPRPTVFSFGLHAARRTSAALINTPFNHIAGTVRGADDLYMLITGARLQASLRWLAPRTRRTPRSPRTGVMEGCGM